MNVLRTRIAVLVPLLSTAVASAQGGHMTGSGMGGYGWMGGYGGIWLPVLVVVAAAGLVVWFMKQKDK